MKKINLTRYIYLSFTILTLLITGCSKNDKNLFLIEEDNLYGYIDSLGNILIKPQYTAASKFNDGHAYVLDSNYNSFIINSKNDIILQPESDYKNILSDAKKDTTIWGLLKEYGIKDFIENKVVISEGLFNFRTKDDLQGFKNLKGEVVVKPKYMNVTPFKNGISIVCISIDENDESYSSQECFIINKNGKQINDIAYNNVKENYTNRLVATIGGKKEVENKNDPIKRKTTYTPGSVLIIDNKGRQIGSPYFITEKSFSEFNENFAITLSPVNYLFSNNIEHTVVDTNLNSVFSINCSKLLPPYCGLLLCKVGDKIGFINMKGEWIINPIFDDAHNFKNNYCIVKLDDKWGLIDKSGKFILEPKYDKLKDYENGLCEFNYSDPNIFSKGYININKVIVWQNIKKSK